MALAYKPGVDPAGALDPIRYAIAIAEQIYTRHGSALVVTSLTEGRHIAGSLHPSGLAVDLRTRDLPPGAPRLAAAELAAALGGDYDVILEADHIHVEYDPAADALPRITMPLLLTGQPPSAEEAARIDEFNLWDFLGRADPATTIYHQPAGVLGVPWWAWLAGGLVVLALAWPRR